MNLVLVYSVIGLLFILWIVKRWQDRKAIGLAKHFGSNKWQILLGFGPLLRTKAIIPKLTEIAKKYGKNSLMFFGPFPFFLTSDPTVIKDILTSKLCINKSYNLYSGISFSLGQGLITLNGAQWNHSRKILNAGFKNSNIVTFLPTFNRRMEGLFKDIDDAMEKGNYTSLLLFLREFGLKISLETIIGRDMDKSQYDIRQCASQIEGALEYISNMVFDSKYAIEATRMIAKTTIYKNDLKIIDTVNTVIAESLHSTGLRGSNPTFLEHINSIMRSADRAIENGQMKREHAISNIFHLFAGSFETTSMATYFVALLLAIHPEYQELAYAEICDIFPNDDEGEFEVLYEHIDQMVYLEMVINEAMRLFAIIPQIGRMVAGGDLTLSNGIILPEGQDIMIDLVNLHRNSDIWGPNAHKFNPDNFLPANIKARHPYAFIPFTKGIRFCIGMRYAELTMKVAMARIIKRYKLTTTATMDDLKLENHVSIQLAKHPSLKFERRKISKTT
ncbi:probable cytochrome P450 313a4 [Stomoxys calcitrans]|uniref:Cytochrome P450 n=1 Tax=Stomoxys calcitrans TaxID=35570 RepID=A0A1I8NYT6_STOCA|nr:probable cytochrome P450 313a4 [Stomoxys calcitrans]